MLIHQLCKHFVRIVAHNNRVTQYSGPQQRVSCSAEPAGTSSLPLPATPLRTVQHGQRRRRLHHQLPQRRRDSVRFSHLPH